MSLADTQIAGTDKSCDIRAVTTVNTRDFRGIDRVLLEPR